MLFLSFCCKNDSWKRFLDPFLRPWIHGRTLTVSGFPLTLKVRIHALFVVLLKNRFMEGRLPGRIGSICWTETPPPLPPTPNPKEGWSEGVSDVIGADGPTSDVATTKTSGTAIG